jgi:hypothetical protein
MDDLKVAIVALALGDDIDVLTCQMRHTCQMANRYF